MMRASIVLSPERGVALVITIMAVALLSALGLSLAMIVDTETRISGQFAGGREVLYAADAAIEIAAQELVGVGDWNRVLAGEVVSAFVDGAPTGQRALADGRLISLSGATDLANAEPRPWGPNNPQWRLFAFGRFGPAYVVAWVADDPAENDGDATRDGSGEDNPGAGIVALRAEAFGLDGAHKVLEATVRRLSEDPLTPGIEMVSWHEIR
jgi:hypothetical protein